MEVIASAFLQALFQALMNPIFEEFFKRRELNDNILERLNTALLTISAVLIDAEEKHITNQSVERWVSELKDAAYHAEDALDDIATEALRCNVEAEFSTNILSQRGRRASLWDFLNRNCEDLEVKMERATKRLERLASQRNVLGLKEFNAAPRLKARLPTTSLVDESEVVGRDEDKDEIMRILMPRNGQDEEMVVVAIFGVGGVGKSTLAQLLYNDQRIQHHFSTKAWAYVSEEFDVFKITKIIYESITLRPCDFTDLNVLQVKLKESLMGKSFLLVLDDLWSENFVDWDLLRQPFKSADKSSRIIVTTRSQRVASIMRAVHTHTLRPLSDGDCWSVFLKQASNDQELLLDRKIGGLAEKIVKKCQGLPLAAKALGGLLRFEGEVEEWEKILNSKIWDLPTDKSNILPVLRVSYYYLPAHLKQCFAYCSIFPKGYAFDKERVVQLWMAEGFLQQTKSIKRLEELGDEYFSGLVSRSLFQQKSDRRFTMHDLINELSQFAAGEFCSRYEDGCVHQRTSEKTRYLSYIRDHYGEPVKFESLREAKFLRTFLPLSLTDSLRSCCLDKMVGEKLLPTLNCLRVVSLSHYKIVKLPSKFFKNLSHTRFLDLSHTGLEKLPKSVCFLYNLQTLLLSSCPNLVELPADFCKLINLRYLNLIGTRLREMPQRFRRLKSLQALTTFIVSAGGGARICELGDLSELRGKLAIFELQRVVDVADAFGANLKSKKHLKEIDFIWRTRSHNMERNINPQRMKNEVEVFEQLRPHHDIKKLTIERYSGKRFPNWLGDPSFSSIICLRLNECQNCESLPSLGQLPGLKELHISSMKGLKSIGSEFYFYGSASRNQEQPFKLLQILRFTDMPDWENWLDVAIVGRVLFPSLQTLLLQKCPKLLGNLPTRIPSLMSLHIHECKVLDFQPDHPDYAYTKLQQLSIRSSCDSLITFPLGSFSSLKSLEIHRCNSLQSCQLPNDYSSNLEALKSLKISDCPNLMFFPERELLSRNIELSVLNCRY